MLRGVIASIAVFAFAILAVCDSAAGGKKPGNGFEEEMVQIGDEHVPKKSAVYFLDLANRRYSAPEKYVVDGPQRLKNRIYVRYHKEEGRWVPDCTVGNGHFASPDRFIVPGRYLDDDPNKEWKPTVVPGEWLGAPGKKFEFVRHKPGLDAWVETERPVTAYWSVLIGRDQNGRAFRELQIINPPRKPAF